MNFFSEIHFLHIDRLPWLARITFAAWISILLFAVQAHAGISVEPGMSRAQALELLRSHTGDEEAVFMESICSLPLGLHFFDGAGLYTVDTGISMLKAQDFPTMYFFQDILLGIRYSAMAQEDFLSLKERYPQGRYYKHRFPGEDRPVRVFEAAAKDRYVFTNQQRQVFVLDEAMRREIMDRVAGSYCWHTKLSSPKLESFVEEYAACVEGRPEITSQDMADDLALCKAYCGAIHPDLYTPGCPEFCDQARDRARRTP